MSNYVIFKENVYIKQNNVENKEYELFFHTQTKYPDNYPYFSTNVSRYVEYTITKENLPQMLKMAQNFIPYGRVDNRKKDKNRKTKIFVLKENSPKIKEILNNK